MNDVIAKLRQEPSLAWKVTVNILGRPTNSREARQAAESVRGSRLVTAMLAARDTTGNAYRKWTGSHWLLSLLADLGYPAGDESVRPLMEESFACWLGEPHKKNIRVINGRTRRCASQEGNAVWSSLKLGFADDRTADLASRLMRWQWPDGGWNCDKRSEADNSSFMETLIPLRALACYASASGDRQAGAAAEQAAEVFLKRQLFKRLRDGGVMDKHFIRLHYPAYWHYDILFGLSVMAEAGFISDPRCQQALDLLESKRLLSGGFPAEESFSRSTRPELSGYIPLDWGGTSQKKMNLFVTANALYVLRAAGRLPPESLAEL